MAKRLSWCSRCCVSLRCSISRMKIIPLIWNTLRKPPSSSGFTKGTKHFWDHLGGIPAQIRKSCRKAVSKVIDEEAISPEMSVMMVGCPFLGCFHEHLMILSDWVPLDFCYLWPFLRWNDHPQIACRSTESGVSWLPLGTQKKIRDGLDTLW